LRPPRAELQVVDVADIERVYAIPNGHPNVAGIATQILAGYDSPAAQRQRIGRTKTERNGSNCCQAK
jgi:hypothetical protein